jgi:integrase
MAKRLTPVAVEKAKADPTRRREIPDGGQPGLYLVIQSSGRKSWAVRYRLHGRPCKLTLDGFLGLAEARGKARAALDRIAKGGDPAAEKQANKPTDGDLFGAVAVEFIEKYSKPKNRSWADSARMLGLRPDLTPMPGGLAAKWRNRHIAEIKKRDVLDVLEAHVARGAPVIATRTLAAVRKLFNWTVARDMLKASPCAGIEAPAPVNRRERVLTDAEIKPLWSATAELGYPFGPMVRLLLLTGQRRGEVAEMDWSEVDLEAKLWTIPRERVKNEKEHLVPLSAAAIEVLEDLPGGRRGLVFTTNGVAPVSGFSKFKARLDKAMGGSEAWTIHDLRRTVATGLQKLGVALPVTEAVLNHISGSRAGVVGIYQRYDYADEKRAALETWSRFVVSLTEDHPASNVIAFP